MDWDIASGTGSVLCWSDPGVAIGLGSSLPNQDVTSQFAAKADACTKNQKPKMRRRKLRDFWLLGFRLEVLATHP